MLYDDGGRGDVRGAAAVGLSSAQAAVLVVALCYVECASWRCRPCPGVVGARTDRRAAEGVACYDLVGFPGRGKDDADEPHPEQP